MRARPIEQSFESLWRRRDDALKPVDGLRALAVLWVIAYHTFAFVGRPLRHGAYEPAFRIVNRGLLGVDVFFVLSGFLIGRLLLREQAREGTIALRRFYVRRALRILPAYGVALGLDCLLVGRNADAAWANVLFVNNFLPESGQCMPWAWSLAVEEQFYVVFPVALLAGAVFVRAHRLAFLVVLVGLFVLVRAVIVQRSSIYVPSADHAQRYYDALYDKPYARFPELLCGVVVAWLTGHTRAQEALRRSPNRSVFGMGVALLVVLAVSTARQPIFEYGAAPALNFLYYTLSPVLFSMAIGYVLFATCCGAKGANRLARLLGWRGFLPVAQLSYSAYLIHMIVISVGVDVNAFPQARSVTAMCVMLFVIPLVTLVAAMPLYVFVEKPLMNLRDRTKIAR